MRIGRGSGGEICAPHTCQYLRASLIPPAEPEDPTVALATHKLTLSDGAQILLRQHGRAGAPRLVLSHGNGLAIDGYASFWSHLCADYEVIVFDMRNHGRNPVHDFSQHRFDRFAIDIGEIFDGVAEAFGAGPCVGIFHSMSAIAAASRLGLAGPFCDALVLVDPPVYPPAGHPLEQSELAEMHALADRASRRPTDYASVDELTAVFSKGRAFSRWVPGAASDMANATLCHRAQTGRWHLCCPREYEAAIYATNHQAVAWQTLAGTLKLPTLLLGADPGLEGQMQPGLLCEALAKIGHFEYQAIPETTHFLQIEKPMACIESIESFLIREVPQCSGR